MKSFGLTNCGLVRQINEDEYFRSDNPVGCLPNLYIIADGMGGHKAGDVASKNCTRYVIEYIKSMTIDIDIEQLLKDAVSYANLKVYEEGIGDESLKGMGSTMVIATIHKDMVYVVNVGDSRLYTFNKDLEQITIDHSVVEELYRAGQITDSEREHHPDNNMITRAMGVEGHIQTDFFKVPKDAIKYVIMCTDGLTKMVSDIEISEVFKRSDNPEKVLANLLDLAMDHGGRDNITIIIVDLESEVWQ